jgi:uncharacterized protein
MPRIILIAVACICIEIANIGFASAQTGNQIAATFDAGVAAYDAGHFDQAYALWKSIDSKDVAAMRNLGILLRKGQGVKKDPAAAEEMFERAARAGLVTALADLADMLLKGEAGSPDAKRALPLLESAAAANHPVAQFELAQMYETGELVPKDMSVARNLYAAAAGHGMKEAANRLAALGPVAPIPFDALALPAVIAPTPQVPVAAKPTSADTGKATRSAFTLQIGAYKSLIDTGAAWNAYQAKHAALLSGYSSNVKRVDLGEKDTWYRLRIVGFGDRKVASALCDNLKKDGGDCFLPK